MGRRRARARSTAWRGSLVLAVGLLASCSGSDTSADEATTTNPSAEQQTSTTSMPEPVDYPPAPEVPDSDTPVFTEEMSAFIGMLPASVFDRPTLERAVAAGDARHAWLIADLLRFFQGGDDGAVLVEAVEELTGVALADDPEMAERPWGHVTNHLIAWDLPAPPDYRQLKGELFTLVEPGWEPFFAEADAEIDWRWLSWGGVLIDDRPLGDPDPCPRGCIPALDDPTLIAVDEAEAYDDGREVFGIEHRGEALALPKNMMEVHEMVNLSLGGERLGIPYCTLCGSAQAFLTDRVPDGVSTPVLRTSGLLSRSNKVMYDLTTRSVIDTFTGRALSGPLHEAGVTLEQITVTVTSWGEWRAEHPETRIIAPDGGIGRDYDEDPLGGRDDEGPIFPIGEVDDRLAVQAPVVGVITDEGQAIAFDAAAARSALADGDEVSLDGISLELSGGGLRARDDEGIELAAHEAFWFAWSQFHPDTVLWTAP